MRADINGRHTAANHHDSAPDGNLRKILSLSQFGNEIDSVHADVIAVGFSAERIHAAKPDAKKHCMMFIKQSVNRQIVTKMAVIDDTDAANRSHIVNLVLGKLINRFVGCYAIFIQTARLRVCIMDDDLVALHCKAMCTSKSGGAGTDDSNGLSGIFRSIIELQIVLHRMIGSVALQQADLYWLSFCSFANTGLFAQGFCGAYTSTHPAKNILVKDRPGRTLKIAGRNLPDKFGDVDCRRTGRHAWRIIAEIAPVSSDQSLMWVQRWVRIRKILFI